MPRDTPVMRAPTRKERVGDTIRGAYESLAEQPLVRIADMLGLSNIGGMAGEDPNAMKIGMMPTGPSRALSGMGRVAGPAESATAIRQSHPALPPEFNMRAPNPSRTAPIDMNSPPPGRMEYLDPEVAEYMNPASLDATTREGQRRLRFLTGK
jgi:hypothetical protein